MKRRVAGLIRTLCVAVLGFQVLFAASAAESAQRDRKKFIPLVTSDSDAATQTNWVAADELLVRFKRDLSPAKRDRLLNSRGARTKPFRTVQSRRVRRASSPSSEPHELDDLSLIQLPQGTDLNSTIAFLRNQPGVAYAEPNYRVRIAVNPEGAAPKPDDFRYPDLWALDNQGQTGGTIDADIDAPEAWAITTGSRKVKVAVIDTGIDYFHPDLAPNIWASPKEIPGNGLDDDANGFVDDVHGYDFVSDDSDPSDDHGHGTHVAGTIGAIGDNSVGVAGVCWEVSLLAVKAFDETGDAGMDQLIDAVQYAVDQGAHIINASWGTDTGSRGLQDVIAAAVRSGVLVIAAAGNERRDKALYPAAFDDVLAVAATNHKDARASFSNFGPHVDLAAPGDGILSTIPNNTYEPQNGTSMATPHVAGAAALILSRHPEFTAAQTASILRNTTDPINSDEAIGSGRLNVHSALLVNAPLPDARLDIPIVVEGGIPLRGTAGGTDFASFSLAYGKGMRPTNWIEIHSATIPVADGELVSRFYTPQIDDGPCVFRLTVRNSIGQTAVTHASATVANAAIATPQNNDIVRAGNLLSISGTVFGAGRTYTLQHGRGYSPSTWSDTGIELRASGASNVIKGDLGTWDTSVLVPDEFHSLRMIVRAGDSIIAERRVYMIYVSGQLKAGWPRYVGVPGEFPDEDWRDLKVADLDGDGFQEVILVEHANSDDAPASLTVFDHDGRRRWSRQLGAGPPYADVPAIADANGDGRMELFVDVGTRLYAFHHDGSALEGKWPLELTATSLGKIVVDLDGDGLKEIVAQSQNTTETGSFSRRLLTVWDLGGNLLRQWELSECGALPDVIAPKAFPAVGNFDSDPELEIIAMTGCSGVAMFDMTKPGGSVWLSYTDAPLLGSPVVGDLDNNGDEEIVIAGYPASDGSQGGLFAFSSDGQRLGGWPVLLEESFASTPALADFDGDGDLEILIAGWRTRKVHLVHHDGFEAVGWPVGPILRAHPKSNPVIGDVNGDGRPDAVFGAPGQWAHAVSAGDLSIVGGIKAWTSEGKPIDLNPHKDLTALVMEGTGGSFLRTSPPVLADLDGDGLVEVICASNMDTAFPVTDNRYVRKNRSTLYVWTLPSEYTPLAFPWPTFQHNSGHTGRFVPPRPKNEPPVVANIPDQTVQSGTQFIALPLDNLVSDPNHLPAEVTWKVTGGAMIEVTVDAKRVATIRAKDPTWLGRETLTFTATDPAGASSSDTAVIEVRPRFEPPIGVSDIVALDEDGELEFDVLANDLDPQGNGLVIAVEGRAANGTLRRSASGRLVYKPRPDFFGVDTFSYMAGDRSGGLAVATVTVTVRPVNDAPTALSDRVITNEDAAIAIDVLANDTDPDKEPFEISSFSQPANGSVARRDNGFVYSPNSNFSGLDQFDYTLSDPGGLRSTASVSVLVKAANDAPVAQNRSFTMNKNSELTVTYLATDTEQDTLTYKVVKAPKHGIVLAHPSIAVFQPEKGFVGVDDFTYTASDASRTSAEASVTVTVIDANNAPTVENRTITTKVSQPVTLTLTALDVDGDPLTFQIVGEPIRGTVRLDGADVTFTPETGFIGDDAFTFRASDGNATSKLATVTLRVTDKNTAPWAETFRVETRMNATTNFTLRASDPESDPLVFELLTQPERGTITLSGSRATFTPKPDYIGGDRFTYRVSDGELESPAATVTITVRSTNEPPQVASTYATILWNTRKALKLPATDTDGDVLKGVILKGPKYGRVTGADMDFVYAPRTNFFGVDSFTFKVWDGQAYSKVGTLTISVVASKPPLRMTAERDGQLAGEVRLKVTSALDTTFQIQASTNLVDWSLLSTHQATGGEPVTVSDQDAPMMPRRFYRALQF